MDITSTITIIILYYFVVLMIAYSILLIASIPETLRKFQEAIYGNISSLISQGNLIPVSIIMPVYNESENIINAALSLLNSTYKKLEIILVNDGSTDMTLEILKTHFSLYKAPLVFERIIETSPVRSYFKSSLYPNLTVIDKEHCPENNGADSINAGINVCHTPLYATIDADTLLEPEALSRIIFTLLSRPHCIAVGGSLYVLNDNKVEEGKLVETNIPRHFLPAMQSIEYIRSFLYGRAGWNTFGGALVYPGAFTLFETQAIREVGGYQTNNPAYDAEIIMRLHHKMRDKKYPCTVHYTNNAQAWTRVPATLKHYWNQRKNWQRGMLQSYSAHAKVLFNSAYGMLGFFTFPFYLFFEIYGPVIEFLSYVLVLVALFTGILDPVNFLWFLMLAWCSLLFFTMAVFLINTITFNKYHKFFDIFRALFFATFEMVGLRQYRALCCTVATVQYFINRKKYQKPKLH